MRKISRTLTLASGLLSIVSLVTPTVIAQESQQKPKPSEEQTAAQTVTVDGQVSAVSETSVTIVDAKKAEKTIMIDTNTKVTKAGKAATPADIKENDKVVVVAVKGEGDAWTAVSIKVV
jgi:sorbitol-specific phosphotransferase system component IIBC